MTDTKLVTLMDDFAAMARRSFLEDGRLSHFMWVLEDASGERSLVAASGGDDKDALALSIRLLIAKHETVRYAMAAEVWTKTLPPGEAIKRAPSQYEDRREALMVFGEDKDGTQRGLLYPIERGPDGVSLGLPEIDTAFGMGRFTGMFEPLR